MSTERYEGVGGGVGGMGSAALYHLARRGTRALGLERFDVPHEHGSSHDLTRIVRLAYVEHPDYVPLLRRAYELWRELESETGERLLHVTGIVEGGGKIVEGVLRSCAEHDLEHEVLSGRAEPALSRLSAARGAGGRVPARGRVRRPRAPHRRARRRRARARRGRAGPTARASGARRRAVSACELIAASSRPSVSC